MENELQKLQRQNRIFREALSKIVALDYDDKEYINDDGDLDYMYLVPREASDNLTAAVEGADLALRKADRLFKTIVISDPIPEAAE